MKKLLKGVVMALILASLVLASCGGGGGGNSAIVGTWERDGMSIYFPTVLDFKKDNTGSGSPGPFTWKTEKEELSYTADGKTTTWGYKIENSKLILIDPDDGETFTYNKQ